MSDANCTVHKLIADIAVFSGENVAMVRYASGYDGQSGWFLPDSELKHLEHPDKAARRILTDQLGMNDPAVRLNHIESFRGNDGSWHLVFHYATEIDAPATVAPSSDLADFAWFPLDALPDRADVAHHGWALNVIEQITNSR